MAIKQVFVMEVEVADNLYTFTMPTNVSYGQLYDAAFKILQEVTEMAQKEVDKAKPQESPQ